MRIQLQQPTPRFYRRVWLDAPKAEYICFPIGLHWLVKKIYRLWQWSLQYNASDLEIKELDAYRRGWEDGKYGREDKFATFSAQLKDWEETNDKD